MSDTLDDVTSRFVTYRPKLYAIAYRTLGSPWSADDAVQETWLRLQRADIDEIDNLDAWLTTVVSRVCIDLIRQDARRREDEAGDVPLGVEEDPSETAMVAADLAVAMQVVLDALGPLERLALVLHDVFGLGYADIAPIVERTPTAARQLASRARARLRDVDTAAVRSRQETAIVAFLEAARQGNFGGLLQLLDPEIELRSDADAVALAAAGADYGAPSLVAGVRGADAVARVFAGRAELARLVWIDGRPAAAYVTEGVVHAIYVIEFGRDRIARIDVLAGDDRLCSAFDVRLA